ncbi:MULTISPECIES: histidine kinase [Streptomyces]|uniref:histidine kinase n=1 Tax=Streptomyces lonegramiae TaxID=3075524 RepID=A0ABU2XE59_9ACTN|nr:histidine kinase [Streptomyces sp. DSM 41529]MDT0543415.1 histidine kinase [Streptomyces sp. DSM 41529]
MSGWTQWPTRQALTGQGLPKVRLVINCGMSIVGSGLLIWNVARDDSFEVWQRIALLAAVAGCGATVHAFRRVTVDRRLGPALGLLALLLAAGAALWAVGADTPAVVAWIVGAIHAMERLPLMAALPASTVAAGSFVLTVDHGPLTGPAIGAGLVLIGYSLRVDEEARGTAYLLLEQERAARSAEAQSAALAERARIAREIHDVLAHSLSAQLVHLEAARLLIERGRDQEMVLERVVAARRMARHGLAETRQALHALRGETAPVEDFLRESAATEGARFETEGEPRELAAETGLAVRRVAQEALTNVRKHAPGAPVEVRFAYQEDEVLLEIRDGGARQAPSGGPAATGAGYGLRGMRERAELLGGTLEAGPAEGGFVVRLRVPA